MKVCVQNSQTVTMPFETRCTVRVTMTEIKSVNGQLGTTEIESQFSVFIPEAHVRAKIFPRANSAPRHYPKLSAPVLTME